MTRLGFTKRFIIIAFLALTVRLVLMLLPSFTVDMNNWMAWSRMLGEFGIFKFYSLPGWTDYTPGFLYYLWVLGVLDKTVHLGTLLYPFLVKLPVILADIGTGLLIAKLFLTKSTKLAKFGFLIYVLNPAVVFANSVWGQTDGLIAFLLVLSAYFLAEKKNVLASSALWALALLTKPQALLAWPILVAFSFLREKFKKTLLFVVWSLFLAFALSLPFFIFKNPLFGLPNLILKMSNESPFTSVMAFNFWALFKGMWLPDSGTFLGATYSSWGIVLLLGFLLVIFLRYIKQVEKRGWLYFILGISYLAFFLFPTRVHERYILVALPFLLISAGLVFSKFEFLLYSAVSLLVLVNLYHPYAYYTPESFLSSQTLLTVTTATHKLVAFLLLAAFFGLLFKDKLAQRFNRFLRFNLKPKAREVVWPKLNLSPKISRYCLIGIILFALVTRVAWLNKPESEYFDEVYHAFTARQILHANPMAWEWWNTPPEGFAYEWTHPPLAKLGMVLGMKVFGENPFGWRIPGALLGVGSVFLIYLIAKALFKDEPLALLAAAVFSLDGLPLVMSRIGMNDSYLLFFTLASIFLFLKNQNYLSAIAFGLALSSKWSVIWAIPILFILWLRRKNKFTPGILWFLVIPPLIYLASYLPMFLSGHSLSVWWEMQKQMWWYHTGLKATHPYTSPWWNWPLLVKPIYLYTSNEVGGFVSRIYAMGNPVVFWGGLLAVAVSAYFAFVQKNKNLAFVVFGYLVFFVPWAASPRIMFLYHYLPSLPFLAIASGYILRRNLKLAIWLLGIGLLVFIYFYSHWAGLRIPLWLDTSYYWFSSWR